MSEDILDIQSYSPYYAINLGSETAQNVSAGKSMLNINRHQPLLHPLDGQYENGEKRKTMFEDDMYMYMYLFRSIHSVDFKYTFGISINANFLIPIVLY